MAKIKIENGINEHARGQTQKNNKELNLNRSISELKKSVRQVNKTKTVVKRLFKYID